MSNLIENLVVNPTEYFRERVHKASGDLKIQLGEDLEYYVVRLLCDFIQPQKFQETLGEEGSIFGTPLVFMLKKANESGSAEQKAQLLKCLGDTSLYVAGYFQDYFNRKTFDVGYYIELGAIAYDHVAQLSRQKKDQAEVFSELSQNFSTLVDVVAEVSEGYTQRDNKDVLAVYDRWTRSNSDRLRKILMDLGIQPISNIPIKIAQ